MKKNFKRILATVVAVATLSVGMGSMTAGAYQVVSSTYKATFQWGSGYSKMINNSTTERLASAYTNVYRDVTGEYVGQGNDGAILGYNEYVYGDAREYSSNGYNFECNGGIYRSNIHYSPLDWSQTQYVD